MSSKAAKSKRKSHPATENRRSKQEDLQQTTLIRYKKGRKSSPGTSGTGPSALVRGSASQPSVNPSEQSTISSYFISPRSHEPTEVSSKGKENRNPSQVSSSSRQHREALPNDASTSAKANKYTSKKSLHMDEGEIIVIEDEEGEDVSTQPSKKRKSRDWDRKSHHTPSQLSLNHPDTVPSSSSRKLSDSTTAAKRRRTTRTNDGNNSKQNSSTALPLLSSGSPLHVQGSPDNLRAPFRLLFQDVEPSSEPFVGSSQSQYLSPIRYNPLSPNSSPKEGVASHFGEDRASTPHGTASSTPPISLLKTRFIGTASPSKVTQNRSERLRQATPTIMLSSSEEPLELLEYRDKPVCVLISRADFSSTGL
jgi:hypothetical protein